MNPVRDIKNETCDHRCEVNYGCHFRALFKAVVDSY